MNAARDVLESLLPDADEGLARRARRLTTLLRLLRAEAHSRAPVSIGTSLERARVELERDRRAEAARVVADLAIHHLEAALGAASFLSLPRSGSTLAGAWKRLWELEATGLDLPRVARPNERAAAVAARMIAALERLDAGSWVARRLAAALERARYGPEAGERAFARLARGSPPALRAAALIGRAESALDRGAVAAAGACLAGGHGLALVDPAEAALAARWTELQGWALLLRRGEPGSAAGVGDAGGAMPPRSGALLPSPLVELRRRRPEWSALIRGRGKRRHATAPAESLPWSGSRRDFGAALLAVFEAAPGGATTLVECDLDPALEPRVAAWLAAERPERAALAASRAWVRHRSGSPLPGTLSPHAQSVAAWPVFGRGSAAVPRAWIWLEFEHHLVPARESLEVLASAWRARSWCRVRSDPTRAERALRRCREAPGAPLLELEGRRE